jgi:hypothetical protein
MRLRGVGLEIDEPDQYFVQKQVLEEAVRTVWFHYQSLSPQITGNLN